jgi:hypothetical protein
MDLRHWVNEGLQRGVGAQPRLPVALALVGRRAHSRAPSRGVSPWSVVISPASASMAAVSAVS